VDLPVIETTLSAPWRWITTIAIAAVVASCAQPGASVKTTSSNSTATAAASPSAAQPTTRPARQVALVGQAKSEKEYLAQAESLRIVYSKPSSEWPKPVLDPGIEHREIGALPPPKFPVENSYSKEKELLGRELFFDPRLSGSGQFACASCHDPDLAWADGRTVSFGHDRTALKRNAPSILFSAYAKKLFWDGRADSLEDQFLFPVTANDEMNGNPDSIAKRLNDVQEYRKQFKSVFNADQIKLEDAAKAVATFERGLANLAGRSKFDKFMAGQTNALSDGAVRGLHLFRTSARCMNCHNGPTFSDDKFHDLGLSYYGRRQFEDLGRYKITKDPADVGRFRTPTLRDVERTKPYMHLGIFNLEGTVAAYNNGMATLMPTSAQKGDPLFPKKDPLLKRLGLGSLERADLVEFLKSLGEPPLRIRPPALPGLANGEASKNIEETKSVKTD
jgi:cytochrome c peroxidase